jgi:magnesium chelatase family protein
MAVGILACEGIVDIEKTRKTAFVGEISLDGNLRAVNGVLSIVCALKELGVEMLLFLLIMLRKPP